MKRLEPEIIDYYNTEVLKMILEKYGMTPMEALRAFVCSETHRMLEDVELGITEFGAGALFPRSNEPSSHACMDIWRLPRGSNTPQLAALEF